MKIAAADLMGKSATAEQYVALKRSVRRLPEPERLGLVKDCLARGLYDWALVLTKSCLVSGAYVMRVFEHGLRTADASTIQCWLECAVTKLGARAVIRRLTVEIETNPVGVAKSLYYLPGLLPAGEPKAAAAYDELKRLAKEKSIMREPKVRPHPEKPGRVLYSDVWADDAT